LVVVAGQRGVELDDAGLVGEHLDVRAPAWFLIGVT
jgi:hypothetical protein